MTSRRCQSCGSDLPVGARFCPTCGSGIGAVPVMPLAEERGPVDDDVVDADPGDRTRVARTLLLTVLAVLAVLIGLSAVTGGDDGDDPDEEQGGDEATDAEPTTSTTRRTSTSEATATTVEGAVPAEESSLEDPLDPSLGMAVLVARGDELEVIDLATGAAVSVPTPEGMVQNVVWADGRVLLHTGGMGPGESTFTVLGDDGTWDTIPFEAGGSAWLDQHGVVYAQSIEPDGSGHVERYGYLDDAGQMRVVELDAQDLRFGPMSSGAIRPASGGILVPTIDGIFLVEGEGEALRVATGQVVASSRTQVLRYGCDDRMVCGLSMLDLATGESDRRLPELPDGLQPFQGWMSPDGGRVVLGAFGPQGPVSLVLARGAWSELDVSMQAWNGGSVTWSSDGSGIAWLDPAARVVETRVLTGPDTGRGDRGRLSRGISAERTAVVPLDGLPESWRPAAP